MTLGESIKIRREALGLTQQQLAQKLFVSRQTVSRWESGTRCPDLIMSKKISMVLGISLDELIPTEHIANYDPRPEATWDLSFIKVMLTGLMLILVAIFLYCADDGNMDASAFFFFGGIIVFAVGLFIPWNPNRNAVIDEDLPQRKCPKCGKEHDFDFPKCPHCGHENE